MKSFIECSDCWRAGVRPATNGFSKMSRPMCGEQPVITSPFAGCHEGFNNRQIDEAMPPIIKCCDCMLLFRGTTTYKYKTKRKRYANGFGCISGVSFNDVEAEAERQEVQKYIKGARVLSEPYVFSGIKSGKRYRQVYGTFKSFTDATAEIIQEAAVRAVKEIADGMLKPEVNNHKHMSTFLCQNCCEAVQVPTDLLGKDLRFKCPTCHQENHYDLTAE